MIILLSPAKTMNLKYPQKDFHCFYLEDALKLRSSLKSMSIKRLMTFFDVSEGVALKTYDYYHSEHAYVTYDMFDGIGYRILKQLSPTIPKNIYALSGLYGLLHLSDTIYPYRLDLKHPTIGSLITFWRQKLYEKLKHEDLIISCLSSEYEVLLDERLNVIHIDIYKDNKKAPSVDAKKVRAAFAVHLDTYGIDEINDFEFMNYYVTSKTNNTLSIENNKKST
jgi:cytoplasmic iron level regulating protein YaaA (DUF328/UPF0246 family)